MVVVVTVIGKCDIAMYFKVMVGIKNKVNEIVLKKYEAELA